MKNMEKEITNLQKNVYDRLEYLEFMLRFRGWISRIDLIDRFKIGEAAATRDIRLYREYAPNNLVLNQKNKKYMILEDTFAPIFKLKISTTLSKLRTSIISEALGMSSFNGVSCPPRLAFPKIEFISKITRAISGNRALNMTYRSIENGYSEKTILPHAIFDNGVHWYVRAFDVTKDCYRTYALTRIVSVSFDNQILINNIKKSEASDFQWDRMVGLELVPHPNRTNVRTPETVEHDFNMIDGCLTINVRAAVAGYWLYHWSVDCTKDHSLEGYNYQLWLRNYQTLYDVGSRKIAPGLSEYPFSKKR